MTTNSTEATVADAQADVPAAPVVAVEPKQEGSLLGKGATTDNFEWVPEKHRVKGQDGTFDVQAMLRKVADANRSLEHRMGKVGHAPDSPDGYAPEVPEGINWDEWKADPKMQGFLKGAHAKGLTNDQVAYVLGQYTEEAKALMEAKAGQKIDAMEAELRVKWSADGEFHRNLNGAFRVANEFLDPEDKAAIDSGALDSPVVIRLLANISKHMAEDVPVSGRTPPLVDDDKRLKEIDTELAAMGRNDPRRNAMLAEKMEIFTRKFPGS